MHSSRSVKTDAPATFFLLVDANNNTNRSEGHNERDHRAGHPICHCSGHVLVRYPNELIRLVRLARQGWYTSGHAIN